MFFDGLHEKDKRSFATLQAELLGSGGKKCISELLGINLKTIYRDSKEIGAKWFGVERIRKQGAGQKSYIETIPNIYNMFLSVLTDHTAGNPLDGKLVWTNLKQEEISLLIYKKYNINVSRTVIRQLLDRHNYKRWKITKKFTIENSWG